MRGQEPVIKGPPAGVQPLAVDMFTTKDFYKDKDSWTDPRYFRCNSARQMVEAMWEQGRIGKNPPTSASWGDSCKDAFPREKASLQLSPQEAEVGGFGPIRPCSHIASTICREVLQR